MSLDQSKRVQKPVDPDRLCGGCGLELTDEDLSKEHNPDQVCPRCKQRWPTPERLPR